MIDSSLITQLVMAIIALVSALTAVLQASKAQKVTDEKQAIVSFFDPKDNRVTTAPAGIPARSYKMDEATKKWLVFDHPPGEQESLLYQVADHESRDEASYTIQVPSAWYQIEYGLIKGSGKLVDGRMV